MPALAKDLPFLTIPLTVNPPNPFGVTKLGFRGAFTIQSATRWDALREDLKSLGWEEPAEHPLTQIDFDKEMLVGVQGWVDAQTEMSVPMVELVNGVRGPALVFVAHDPGAFMPRLAAPAYGYRIQLVRVERFEEARVELRLTDRPAGKADGGNMQTLIAAIVGPKHGDVIDSLAAKIEPASSELKAGDDIKVRFTLQIKPMTFDAPDPGHNPSARVWDGKYSNGYRNHAFEVRRPDGSVVILRNAEKPNWEKNAPHPVKVTPSDPYIIPTWTEERPHLSLKDLGLDTSRPGKYVITGWYQEDRPKNEMDLWCGRIVSNTIEVEVK